MSERIAVTPALIDGREIDANDHIEVRSPFDGRLLGRVPRLDGAQLDRAIAVAATRHREGPLPAFERAAILDRAISLLEGRVDQFTRSISEEAAKPVSSANTEAHRAIETLRFSAVQARTLTGETVALDASEAGVNKFGFVKRIPVGVVLAISPFNFPLNLVCHKVAPAIAAGCPVVLKPASATPLTALRLAHLFEEAGLPAGWLNVVTCPGSMADRLVTHDDVAYVTFTGSPPVGWSIRAKAPRKRVCLELGNNAPVVVHDDADLELAASKVVTGGFGYSGQTCISVQRVHVQQRVHDEFAERVATLAAGLRGGDPGDPSTTISSLIDRGETERVTSWVGEAVEAGAKVLTGAGEPDEHGVLAATVLDRITPDMRVWHDEVFGPVVGISSYDSFEEGLAMANDTRYGLQASVFTRDVGRAFAAADTLRFGGVLVNESPTWRADQQPYGGVADSGNTREGPAYAVREMTEERMVAIQL
ncbi:MAG: aldehyde dehydrogenase family protein [Microthrixaceae bacterium]